MNTDNRTTMDLSLSVAIGAPSVAVSLLPLPQPREAIEIGPATMEDVAWIDRLQRAHSKQVGWHPRGTIEGKIGLEQIIVARDAGGVRIGYCMASDRYMKREDVGIIYQLNIEPGHQRGYVGAALLKAQFERSAYGCRLYSCWCAQDIEANRFWEAMGFVPLAFRAGSEKRGRVHIFWQKRIREDDVTTPWWFPSQTQGGSMADRLVLPIPPGTHWSDAKPMILPGQASGGGKLLEDEKRSRGRAAKNQGSRGAEVLKAQPLTGGLCFAPPSQAPAPAPVAAHVEKEKQPREKRVKAKNDPKLVKAVRELRDRYLEHVNTPGNCPLPEAKYNVAKQIAQRVTIQPAPVASPKQLPEAA